MTHKTLDAVIFFMGVTVLIIFAIVLTGTCGTGERMEESAGNTPPLSPEPFV